MRKAIVVLLLALGISHAVSAQNSFKIPDNVKRILFLGNSITYSGQYISYLETYLTLRYPHKQLEFINVGLPSETVSGLSEPNHAGGKFPRPDLHERLARILKQVKPDLVLASYGMNDGIYLPFDDARFRKFKEGIVWMHNEVEKSGAHIVHLTPSIFDQPMGEAYANVLDIYSDWLISLRYTDKWDVADIHWPMKKNLEDKRLADSSFSYTSDGIHPNAAGHWMMAKLLLLFLGEKQVAPHDNIQSAISIFPMGAKVLTLVEQRQQIMKDAWLRSTGFKRPDMNIGLPLEKARLAADSIEVKIRAIMTKV